MDKKIPISIVICAFFIGTVFFSGCTLADEDQTDGITEHFACRDGKCISVVGPGADECRRGSDDCVHNECVDNKCETIKKQGTDECETDEDCA